MTPEAQARLYKKYPDIFAERKLPMTQTCMCWGLDIGDGWADIIDRLCADFERVGKVHGFGVRATQVKEKFGTLRFYYSLRLRLNPVQEIFYALWDKIYVWCLLHKVPFPRIPGKPQAWWTPLDEWVHQRINRAEDETAKTCELCGKPGKLNRGGWIECRCPEHTDPDNLDEEEDDEAPVRD